MRDLTSLSLPPAADPADWVARTVSPRAAVPSDPSDPAHPAHPAHPSDPGDPGDPGDPADPADPGDPVDPADPVARTTAALQVASVGYTAAHGDPIARTPERRRRLRWTVSWQVGAAAGLVVLLVAGGVALRTVSLAPGPAVVLPVPAPSGTAADPTGVPAEVVVDVVGAVATPGVVRLPEGSRVVDAIAAAGGSSADAQVSALNLARILVDGEQIVVPRPGEQPVGADAGSAGSGDALLDLNGADEAALDALPGIGPVLAGRIVAHREDRPFTSVDELADVAGIGPTLLERLRALVRV
ncbi:ComEA family DNA-binding protein [Cellulomonas sp.]|uniref:ComEA family DNA-binding protein n=1 Tax=Cellulomonas sp. TaxID=40001 RepID=UPI003BA8AB95